MDPAVSGTSAGGAPSASQSQEQTRSQSQPQSRPIDVDELQHLWQYMDSSGTGPNGVPLTPQQLQQMHQMQQQIQQMQQLQQLQLQQQQQQQQQMQMQMQQQQIHQPPVGMPLASMMPGSTAVTEGSTPLTEDENGMYNELGDVFNMFFNLDTDDSHTMNSSGSNLNGAMAGLSTGVPSPAAVDLNAKVQLPRTGSVASSGSFGDGISPGNLLGYPSMSPATLAWLQSLANSASCESLTGLVSPVTMNYGPNGSSIGGMGSAGASGNSTIGEGASGSVGAAPATVQGDLPRSASCEIIDWKAYNDAAERSQKETPKWRVIPQHGPHADDPIISAVGSTQQSLSTATSKLEAVGSSDGPLPSPAVDDVGSDGGLRDHLSRQIETIKSTMASLVGAALPEPTSEPVPPSSLQPQQLQQQNQQRLLDEKNKRKAIVSPEYVQYGSNGGGEALLDPIKYEGVVPSLPPASLTQPLIHTSATDPAMQYATQVPDASGRRPSKKSLHHTAAAKDDAESSSFIGGGIVRCKCTGKCRNARCACVKAGFVCGTHCKCVSCANPFVPMAREGIDIQVMVTDVCLMQYLSKVKDMQELLDSTVSYECCQASGSSGSVQVKHTVQHGFTCPECKATFTYSWCSHRLCNDRKKPRKHCAKCRRCGDHRNEHCDDCNHCYFAGVANSFRCSCKDNKNGGGADESGTGGKSRSVIANTTEDETKDTRAEPRSGAGGSNGSANGGGGGSSGSGTLAAGLSNTEEAGKDEDCRVQ